MVPMIKLGLGTGLSLELSFTSNRIFSILLQHALYSEMYSFSRIRSIEVHSTSADFHPHTWTEETEKKEFAMIDVSVVHAFMAFLHTYFDYCKT